MKFLMPLRYFFVMTILLLLSGLWMFALHTSMRLGGTLDYYAPKTFFGLLEVASPHFFSMGLLVFILTHFFAIIQGIKQEIYQGFSLLFFLFFFLSNVSGFFITDEGIVWAFVKFISTLLFVLYSLWAMVKVYKLF